MRISSLSLTLLMAAGVPAASAADSSLAIGPQLMIGTAGFEPGVALEIHTAVWQPVTLRPEVFISDDGKVGAGGSLLWAAADYFSLGDRQQLSFGPRVVYHNSDEDGLEVSAFGVWDFVLGAGIERHHNIEALAAIGVVDDRDPGDGANFLISGGAAYIYRF